jgi:hypothetical protein
MNKLLKIWGKEKKQINELEHGKEEIDNLHVDKNNTTIIHSESYIILPQTTRYIHIYI